MKKYSFPICVTRKRTFSLKESHFLLNRDCFEGTITMSVFVLSSSFGTEAYCDCFFLEEVLFNSSITKEYPFFAESTNLASFIFWNATDTFGETEAAVDLNFPYIVSVCQSWLDLWVFSAPDAVVFPPCVSSVDFVEELEDCGDSCFPRWRDSLT